MHEQAHEPQLRAVCETTYLRPYEPQLATSALQEMDVARELDRGEVDDAESAARVGDVEGHAQRVELAVVGEALVRLLGVVGRVEQLNARIELLNAPNNAKQTYECFTNNGELNSLCVAFNSPDAGNTIRIINLAPVEFPCYIHLRPKP